MENAILIVSHNYEISSGIKNLLVEVSPNVPIYVFGGATKGRLGTNYEDIKANISELSHVNFLSFYDLGSSKMCLNMLKKEMKKINKNIIVLDVALVEGSFFAAFSLENSRKIDDIISELDKFKIFK